VRTALYNFLLARKLGGTFILRIEDTDQVRYVQGAEEYILNALEWLGLSPDESVTVGGEFGPYRQSERKALYLEYAQQLIDSGHAYYAFDTAADLEAARAADPNFKYGGVIREKMKNSLVFSEEETQQRIASGEAYTVRIKIPRNELIDFEDIIRGRVSFHSDELDDKVILKADGMPTYHLANIVDDHLMQITHVIRGEEWLPSTPLHVVLYRAFGWEAPQFAHLPLILKPSPESYINKNNIDTLSARLSSEFVRKHPEMTEYEGKATDFIKMVFQDKENLAGRLKENKKDKEDKKLLKIFLKSTLFGKLSKRDGDRLGFPVFPLSWAAENEADSFKGFDEFGFLPSALLNFLAFLGWNPGTEQEIFSMDDLIQSFDLERVSKSGARFNFDKARWFNQQYIIATSGEELATFIRPLVAEKGYEVSEEFLAKYCDMMKERAVTLPELLEKGYYCFEEVKEYDEKTIRKRWSSSSRELFEALAGLIDGAEYFEAELLENAVKNYIHDNDLKFGDILPILRLALSGTTQGASIFEIMALIGRSKTAQRFKTAFDYFDTLLPR
jgi:glutamyl/glutaminyl-tRNA synthetase